MFRATMAVIFLILLLSGGTLVCSDSRIDRCGGALLLTLSVITFGLLIAGPPPGRESQKRPTPTPTPTPTPSPPAPAVYSDIGGRLHQLLTVESGRWRKLAGNTIEHPGIFVGAKITLELWRRGTPVVRVGDHLVRDLTDDDCRRLLAEARKVLCRLEELEAAGEAAAIRQLLEMRPPAGGGEKAVG
jgi:hypothetical protein